MSRKRREKGDGALRFAIEVAGMYLRYTKPPGGPLESMRPVPNDPRPRYPIVDLATARARGWLP